MSASVGSSFPSEYGDFKTVSSTAFRRIFLWGALSALALGKIGAARSGVK